MNFPILEFDPAREAILTPRPPKLSGEVPTHGVICFFMDVIERLAEHGRLIPVGALKSEIGRHPIYRLEHNGTALLVFHPGVGAPLVSGLFEEMIAVGVRRWIACGGCGVLDPSIEVGEVVVLTSAVRDEGTSYHYLPPEREVLASPAAVAALQRSLESQAVPYRIGKTWTTDAYYRETIERRNLRIADGCSVVEMEAAAFFAVAQFRQVQFGQLVYGGDVVVPNGWDHRDWTTREKIREDLFWLAVNACVQMAD